MISFPPDAYCGFPHILWQMLYGLGARKVVMIGVPVLGCSPSARIAVPSQLGQCLTAGNQLALGFNAGLKQLVDGFHTTLPDFKLVYANSYDPVSDMISNPRAYGMCKLYGVSCHSYHVNLIHEFFQQHLACLYGFISILNFLVLWSFMGMPCIQKCIQSRLQMLFKVNILASSSNNPETNILEELVCNWHKQMQYKA